MSSSNRGVRERKFLLKGLPAVVEKKGKILRIAEVHFPDVTKVSWELLLIIKEHFRNYLGEEVGSETYAEMMRSGKLRVRVELDGFKPLSSVRIGEYGAMRKYPLPYRLVSDFFDAGSYEISKRRYLKDSMRFDVFSHKDGEELILAESDQSEGILKIPEWLLPYFLREVTDDEIYYHDHMVLHGVPLR